MVYTPKHCHPQQHWLILFGTQLGLTIWVHDLSSNPFALLAILCPKAAATLKWQRYILRFAIHPVHTESICYVVGRADIICAQVRLQPLLHWRSE